MQQSYLEKNFQKVDFGQKKRPILPNNNNAL